MERILKGTKIAINENIEQEVEEKIFALAKLAPQALAFRVELELTTRHHQKGKIFRAEVNVDLPRKVLRAEGWGENINQAINQIKDEIKREIIKYKELKKHL